jgi:hypothetical protein
MVHDLVAVVVGCGGSSVEVEAPPIVFGRCLLGYGGHQALKRYLSMMACQAKIK